MNKPFGKTVQPVLKVDFREDLVEFFRSELTGWGYTVPAGDDDQEISFKYFNIVKRRIEPMPRNVLQSRELVVPAQEKAGFEALCEKIRNGSDVNWHLSRLLLKSHYHDPMLNDWGIHHFHLGINPTATRFIERTGPLLFAVVRDDAVYMINVYSHGDWANRDLLEIINTNWPTLLDDYRVKDVLDVEFVPTEEEHLKLRGIHINTMMKLSDGSIVVPPGGGMMASGHSVEAIRSSDYFFKRVRSWEELIKNNSDTIIAELRKSGVAVGSEIELSFVIAARDEFYAVEKSSGHRFPLKTHRS